MPDKNKASSHDVIKGLVPGQGKAPTVPPPPKPAPAPPKGKSS
jgi:hypothetical protein